MTDSAAQDKVEEAIPAGKNIGLSVVSKKYDIDGDGKLDEAETAMRNMDTSGRGYLTNDKVYGLMKEQLQTQKELFKFKKIVIGLAVLVVLLTLSNLGTSIAAAHLAKDTTTNSQSQLVNSKTGEDISVQSASAKFEVKREEVEETGESGRDLVRIQIGSSFIIENADAKNIIDRCWNGHKVDLFRTWYDGSKTAVPFCGYDGVTVDRVGSSNEYIYLSNGVEMYARDETQLDTTHYLIDGDAFYQDAGKICSDDDDCDSGLSCVLNAVDNEQQCAAVALYGEECDLTETVCNTGLICHQLSQISCLTSPCFVGVCSCDDDTDCDQAANEMCVEETNSDGFQYKYCSNFVSPPPSGAELPVREECTTLNDTSECSTGDFLCLQDPDDEKSLLCGCDTSNNDGCSGIYSKCVGGNTCECDPDNDTCTGGLTCMIHCGVGLSSNSCWSQAEADGYCQDSNFDDGATCDGTTGQCVLSK